MDLKELLAKFQESPTTEAMLDVTTIQNRLIEDKKTIFQTGEV